MAVFRHIFRISVRLEFLKIPEHSGNVRARLHRIFTPVPDHRSCAWPATCAPTAISPDLFGGKPWAGNRPLLPRHRRRRCLRTTLRTVEHGADLPIRSYAGSSRQTTDECRRGECMMRAGSVRSR